LFRLFRRDKPGDSINVHRELLTNFSSFASVANGLSTSGDAKRTRFTTFFSITLFGLRTSSFTSSFLAALSAPNNPGFFTALYLKVEARSLIKAALRLQDARSLSNAASRFSETRALSV
jgi:hypothetical protein